MGKDFYSVLDIEPDTDKKEIRQAYVQLARQYHPDVNKESYARERFEEINMAYKVLSDDETRTFYNLFYKGAQNFPACQDLSPWWKRYELAVSICILSVGAVMWISILVWLITLVVKE
jgi:curved DNA-binding protein CbpA